MNVKTFIFTTCLFVSCYPNARNASFILDTQTRNLISKNSESPIASTNHIHISAESTSISDLIESDLDKSQQDSIISTAERALKQEGYTVVNKDIKTPSGDPHDFFTLAPYYWPDPQKPDGLPYIHKDGQSNPEIKKFKSHANLFNLCRDVKALGLAFKLTSDPKYAIKAAELTRIWFFYPDTKMNPHLTYAQHIPGRTDGRGIGLIDVFYFIDLIDGIQLIKDSEYWSKSDMLELKLWFKSFLEWMLISKQGKEASRHKNNIGTYYDLQVIAYALFTDQPRIAINTIKKSTLKRIEVQFDIDGKQPFEVVRTRGWNYAVKNLQGWFYIAMLAEKVDIDIWNYETGTGKSLRKAFQWMVPFAEGKQKWPYEQISSADMETFKNLSNEASIRFPDMNFRNIKIQSLKK